VESLYEISHFEVQGVTILKRI